MYEGWLFPFRHGSRVSAAERSRALGRDRPLPVSDNHGSLIRFNSTFLEMIDRRFRQRGMVLTCLAMLAVLVFLAAWVYLVVDSVASRDGAAPPGFDGFFVFVTVVLAAGVGVVTWLVLAKDFFTFTHYPIRFDRRTRMVHAFFGAREGGVASVPWDEAFFHVGRTGGADSGGEGGLCDIRCHVVDADGAIRRTFAVGHYFDEEAKVLAEWEFIRRYMEDGPEGVFEEPRVDPAVYGASLVVPTRRIDLSVVPSLRNCYDWVVMAMPQAWFGARLWLMPLYGPLALCRWSVMSSCRAPTWPRSVDPGAAPEPADPHRLPEPRVHAQWLTSDG